MITHSCLRSSALFVSLTFGATAAFAAVKDDVVANYAQVPLHFEANQGQARDDVQFLARGPGYGVYLTANEAVLALSADKPQDCKANDRTERERVLRMRLLGGAQAPAAHALDEQQAKANYFVGQDSSTWRTNIPTYAKVRYDAVYPGIDVVYYGNERQLEYDFVLAPGAEPKQIELAFDGADRVEIAANGDLVLHACGREIRQAKPVVYQNENGRHDVEGRYVRKGKNRIGFAVASYDRSRPLIIDPIVLSYATYLGGTQDPSGKLTSDVATGVAVDSRGNAYVTGFTSALDFPVTAGAYQTSFGGGSDQPYDAFVTKFNADGSVAYSTYLGGSDTDLAYRIAVDGEGSAYVIGTTNSGASFPTTPGAFGQSSAFFHDVGGNIFVTKLDPTGSALVYSTLFGGAHGGDVGVGIAVDHSGNAYFTGRARSADFPTTPGAFQQPDGGVFIAKLNATGSALVYSSRFGSVVAGPGIAIDDEGNAYVTGGTMSANYPVTSGAYQTVLKGALSAFVTKLGPVGELVYSTYLGGESDPSAGGFGIAVDATGAAYVAGNCRDCAYFATTPGAYRPTPTVSPDGTYFATPYILSKLNSSGSALVYSTYLGGNPRAIAVDASGRAYLAGGEDPFFTIVESSGSWASVSGIAGSGKENVTGIAVDAVANVWVVGYTNSDAFPVTENAYQHQRGADIPGSATSSDGFVMKFATDASRAPSVIQAEDFDHRGNGLAYHDNTPGNQGDAGIRTGEDVDIFNAVDIQNTFFDQIHIVKNFEAGEWLAYTFNVPDAGSYNIELHASTRFDFPNPAYHIEIDGINYAGTVVLPDTGGWENYQWLGNRRVPLTAGTHELKLVSERPYFALDAIRITPAMVSQPYLGKPFEVPGTIATWFYDFGGEGIAYHDNSPGNQGDAGLRGDDVDLFTTSDEYSPNSPYVIKNFEAGEWLAYTINVPYTDGFNISIFAATNFDFPQSAYHIEVDGVNKTGTIVLPDTGGWDKYAAIGKSTIPLVRGVHVLKVVAERPYFAFRAIGIGPVDHPLVVQH